jgi:glycosyltransferase involved in cell wall biosynthesis
MNILILHNRYQQRGGEDTVFENESLLLTEHGHTVSHLIFTNEDIKSTTDKLIAGIRGIYHSGSGKKLEDKIRECNPDIIHVHNFFPLASPAIFSVAEKYQIPVVVTLHNFRLICPSTFLYFNNAVYENSIRKVFPLDAIVKGVYRNSAVQTAAVVLMTGIHKLLGTWRTKVDKYVILTDFARQKFLHSSLNLREDQISVKPNFVYDVGVGDKRRNDVFLFLGRLSDEKGIDVLLQAADLHGFSLKIIGDGPLREQVEQRAARNPRIQYLGFRNREAITAELKKCKALVLPSVWYEGLPMTILEAFSTGTPVIASNLGGPAEIIADGVNGLHFRPGDAQDLVNKIRRLSSDPQLAQQLGIQARRTYEAQYTPEKNYAMLLQVYGEAIRAKKAICLPILRSSVALHPVTKLSYPNG